MYSNTIDLSKTALGIELGSTRIKAVLVNKEQYPIASSSHTWENRLENGAEIYSQEDIWSGIRSCFASLVQEVKEKFGVKLKSVGAIGISAMMHGYMAFDENGKQLVPFRTWRNSITGKAASELTELFGFNIPQRWSITYLYQAILDGEEHVRNISFLTTLAGYIH